MISSSNHYTVYFLNLLYISLFFFLFFFFFFSSRRRHTRLVSDWSSDVCSSDLDVIFDFFRRKEHHRRPVASPTTPLLCTRSEERRVGKECRSRWSPYH